MRKWTLGLVSLTAALTVAACGGDETSQDATSPDGETTSEVAPTGNGAPDTLLMPDLSGLQQEEALSRMESAGIDEYEVEEEASLDPEGRVLDQLPRPGSEVRGSAVVTIAVPLPPMPDYVGRRVGDARAELEGWGVEVLQEEQLSDEQPAGEVLDTTPDAGEQVGTQVLLRESVSPIIGRLGVEVPEVSADGGDGAYWRQDYGSASVNGTLYEDSIYAAEDVNPGDLAYWEFNLGRDWETFEATVGLLDDSESDQVGRFRVVLDGSTIEEVEVPFGQSTTLRTNVADALRLRLEVVSTTDGEIGMAWGDARLLGLPSEVPRPIETTPAP